MLISRYRSVGLYNPPVPLVARMSLCAPFNLNDSTLAGLYCSCGSAAPAAFNISSSFAICPATKCLGICANPDISGVGVRAAFYAQSVMNCECIRPAS
jgi:hypothetical protein